MWKCELIRPHRFGWVRDITVFRPHRDVINWVVAMKGRRVYGGANPDIVLIPLE